MELTGLNSNFSELSAEINTHSGLAANAVDRLSSGERFSRAADDVASLSISTRLTTQVTALRSLSTNLTQAETVLQVADTALLQTEEILQRMSQLAVMANSGAITDSERGYLKTEMQNMLSEIDRISETKVL